MNHDSFRALHSKFTTYPLAREIWESDEHDEWFEHLDACVECSDWHSLKQVESRGIDVADFPCVHVALHSTVQCDVHTDAWECADMTLVRTEDGFAIPVRDGGSSYIQIDYCPWCGVKI